MTQPLLRAVTLFRARSVPDPASWIPPMAGSTRSPKDDHAYSPCIIRIVVYRIPCYCIASSLWASCRCLTPGLIIHTFVVPLSFSQVDFYFIHHLDRTNAKSPSLRMRPRNFGRISPELQDPAQGSCEKQQSVWAGLILLAR